MPDTNLEYTKTWLSEEDFPHLGFSRNWENPSDYPTYEPDESVVRADMQSLHDETKDYINNELIPAVVESNANEAARNANEQARAEADAAREAAEAGRAENELERIAAEELRVLAEQARVDEAAGVVAQAAVAGKSWAVGGTGTREGENTNNAKYWSEQARKIAGGGVDIPIQPNDPGPDYDFWLDSDEEVSLLADATVEPKVVRSEEHTSELQSP